MLLLFLLVAGCGYTLVQEKGVFQGQVVSVDVPVFKNNSLEPHVPGYFTEAFTRELVTSGLFDVNKGEATNALQGTIATVRIVPTALSTQGIAVEKTVTVTLTLALTKKDGKLIKSWALGDAEPYRVEPINLEDFNKREALKRIAARIARRFGALVLADLDRKAF
jgi:outer membrane lipopolysaccharide assembly protein LptE/RlpB